MIYLNKTYNEIIRTDLLLKQKYNNINRIPKLKKIIINMTIKNRKRVIEPLIALEMITGQKPVVVRAKKSIATFNLRKNMYIASKITLQNINMYLFLKKLIYIVLPKIREFRGLSGERIDKTSNYSLPIHNVLIFPEIEYQYDIFNDSYGMDISLLTTAKTNIETKLLLSSFQLPLKR